MIKPEPLQQYTHSLQEQLRKQAALISQMERDLEEARLYLQREQPNTERALARVCMAQAAILTYRDSQ